MPSKCQARLALCSSPGLRASAAHLVATLHINEFDARGGRFLQPSVDLCEPSPQVRVPASESDTLHHLPGALHSDCCSV